MWCRRSERIFRTPFSWKSLGVDEVVPLQARIEAVTDEADLEEVYDTERHLLYVACPRARERLWVSGVRPGSEFLEDMGG